MKTYFATISLALLLFSFSANAQDKFDVGAACETSEDCASGNCNEDGVCAAAEVDPNPDQAQATPTAPQDPSKKKLGEFCLADNECASNQCKTDPDRSKKAIMINGIFCGIHANVAEAAKSTQCQEALKPQGCRLIPFTVKTPDGRYVQQPALACPQDMPAKVCINATCTNEEFFVSDFLTQANDRCTDIIGIYRDSRVK